MLKSKINNIVKSSAMRFIMPVISENIATVLIGLVFSSIIGGISKSSLAAVGIANSAIAVVSALFTVITTGSAVLTARYVGKSDRRATSDMVEQSIFFSAALGLITGGLCAAFANPIMRLLMADAEVILFNEAEQYFRILMLSFPFLSLFNTVSGVLRATGESRAPMTAAIIQNVIQIAAAYLLISVFKLSIFGAGLSYLICRVFGTAFAFTICVRNHRCYSVHLGNLLKPNFPTIGRLLNVGLPAMIESLSVQGGYLVGNSMIIGLGTYAASVYQVVNTVYTFVCMPQTITTAITITFVGQALGAGDYKDARKKPLRIFAVALAISYTIGIITALIGSPWCSLYTNSPEVREESSRILWLMLLYIYPAVELNAIDPALRAGGDTRFVMLYSTACIWLIRLPLTYVFCYVMKLGASGAFLANIINLYARSVFSLVRFLGGKWMTKLEYNGHRK